MTSYCSLCHDNIYRVRIVSYFAIPGFRREVDEKCALLRYYAASSGNFLPTFRDDLPVLSAPPTLFPIYTRYWDKRLSLGFLTPEDGTDRLSRNVGTKLPLFAA